MRYHQGQVDEKNTASNGYDREGVQAHEGGALPQSLGSVGAFSCLCTHKDLLPFIRNTIDAAVPDREDRHIR